MSAMAARSDEWYAARRELITSTDIPIILGLSPYKSEADLAAEKRGEEQPIDLATERRFRLGLALESVIRDEDQVEHGKKLRRVSRFIRSGDIPWAGTSLDFERVGEKVIVEAKTTRTTKADDGLPQDWEAQVRWQMGVAGYPAAHVACLRSGSVLECFDIEHDERIFRDLVAVAEDFRRRLAEGGPFSESKDSVRRRYPQDDGEVIEADAELAEAVRALIDVRARIKALEADDERIAVAIQTRMGPASMLRGDGFRVTWKRTKDVTRTDWQSLAAGFLRQMPDEERDALIGLHSETREGSRRFVVTQGDK